MHRVGPAFGNSLHNADARSNREAVYARIRQRAWKFCLMIAQRIQVLSDPATVADRTALRAATACIGFCAGRNIMGPFRGPLLSQLATRAIKVVCSTALAFDTKGSV